MAGAGAGLCRALFRECHAPPFVGEAPRSLPPRQRRVVSSRRLDSGLLLLFVTQYEVEGAGIAAGCFEVLLVPGSQTDVMNLIQPHCTEFDTEERAGLVQKTLGDLCRGILSPLQDGREDLEPDKSLPPHWHHLSRSTPLEAQVCTTRLGCGRLESVHGGPSSPLDRSNDIVKDRKRGGPGDLIGANVDFMGLLEIPGLGSHTGRRRYRVQKRRRSVVPGVCPGPADLNNRCKGSRFALGYGGRSGTLQGVNVLWGWLGLVLGAAGHRLQHARHMIGQGKHRKRGTGEKYGSSDPLGVCWELGSLPRGHREGGPEKFSLFGGSQGEESYCLKGTWHSASDTPGRDGVEKPQGSILILTLFADPTWFNRVRQYRRIASTAKLKSVCFAVASTTHVLPRHTGVRVPARGDCGSTSLWIMMLFTERNASRG